MSAATFLALGDSYTVGEGVPEHECWPERLSARLRQAGVATDDPQVIARTGWTTAELSAAMDGAGLHPPYDLVTLLIGVNNQYRGRSQDEYRAQFRALLARAIALAGKTAQRVIVISIPDWGVTPFARGEGRDPRQVAAQIDAFNTIAREEAGALHARHVDITGISRAPTTRNLLAADGLHPSGAQYARWVDAIAPLAAAALKNPPDDLP
ncbi:MAG TPA: SGNH/GDSL hydrolase family protein [Rhodanobacteraceae bacterium]|nr:SGNH/GDSL hydrolase family protein [Rhodanobacteraceae bacterium]